jgi:isoleucyl-tRNA synthetase
MGVLETREELRWPADLYLEGSDQYRGWFNSSLITGVAVKGAAPYKGILSHGFTLDGEGRKMSKSLGNTIDPNQVCQQLGADILRLWVASVDYQSDHRISDAILNQITEVYRKIRNTLRFMLGNLSGFNPKTDRVPAAALSELDRYALARLHRMIERVVKAYDNYEFHLVYQTIHHFCAVEMSSFYLDIIKDRLYANAVHDPARKASQTVMYDALMAITTLISPILPHTADEVWKFIPGTELISVQLAELPKADRSLFDDALERKWEQFLLVRDEVLKALEEARKAKTIGNSLGAKVLLFPTRETAELLSGFEQLDQLFIVSQVETAGGFEQAPEDALKGKHTAVKIVTADGEKCERCWIVTPEVGQNKEHPTLCNRCNDVVQAHYAGQH